LTDISDVVSHLIDRDSRTLLPAAAPLISIVLDARFPAKFNIDTLTQVFDAFDNAWKQTDPTANFIYDGVPWLATVTSITTYVSNSSSSPYFRFTSSIDLTLIVHLSHSSTSNSLTILSSILLNTTMVGN